MAVEDRLYLYREIAKATGTAEHAGQGWRLVLRLLIYAGALLAVFD